MNDCLFCKIIEGKIPSIKIYEDENTFAFLDINPVNPGHILVIPKKHSKNIFDIEKKDLKNLIDTTQKIAIALKEGLNLDGINILNNNESAAGQIIFHTHIHIIPRFSKDGFKHWTGKTYKKDEGEKIAKKIISKKIISKISN